MFANRGISDILRPLMSVERTLMILLVLLINPSFKVDKIESVRILYFFLFYPLSKERKMLKYFFSIENSVYHMTTKQTHFYFIS